MPRPSESSLTIVILSYNVEQLLKNCLTSIFSVRHPADNWQVVVIDNASSDNSMKMVKKHFPQVKTIINTSNLGFSAANNIALKQFKTKYSLLLNPDTVVYPNTIQTVLDYMDIHPDVGAATCRVELPDGSLDYSSHRRFPNPWNAFLYFFTGIFKSQSSYADSHIPATVHEIDSLTGAFALIRTQVGNHLNWLDEDYYWNGEDLDFCYRVKQAGWKIVFIPNVKITHFKGSSSGIWKTGQYQIPKKLKLKMVDSGITAMRVFYDKHYAPRYPLPFNWFIYLGQFTLKMMRYTKVYLTGAM